MDTETLDVVKFDPEQVKRVILHWEKKARDLDKERERALQLSQTYRQLLRLHGHEEPEFGPVSTIASPVIQVGVTSAMIAEPDQAPTIADAAVETLRQNGGRMHGKKILEAVQSKGLMKTAKFPMTQLTNSLRRDGRIQKDGRARNTWRLRPGIQ